MEWLDGNTSDTSYARQIFTPTYWKIADVVVIVSEGRKETSSSQGMHEAKSSPFMSLRLSRMKQKNKTRQLPGFFIMESLVNLPKLFVRHMGIDLSCRNRSMAKHSLNRTDIGTVTKEVRSK